VSPTLKEFKQTLVDKGIRHSKKREVILETFFRSGGHQTIEDVLERVKKVDPKIGYVTVYRALRLLKELGLAHQWQFGDGHSRFEKAAGHHDHLICVKCGRIIEFEEDEIERLQEKVTQEHHFKMLSHIHEIHGYCSRCHS